MTFQPPHRPDGRSAWFGKDLARSEDWIYQLPPRAIEEIDASVRRLNGRNAYERPVEAAEFPLTTITADVGRLRKEIATGRGFFVIRGLQRDRYSDNDLGLIFRGFGAHFGRDLTQSAYGDRLGDIRDISDVIVERNMRRGYQSGGFQTAHTDPSGEVGIVAMLSLQMAKSGGESLIASAHTVHNMMLDWCPEFLALFYDGFVLRRPDSDAKAMGRPPLIGKVPGFCFENNWLNCDHQNGYIRRAVENGDASLDPKQQAAIAVFTSLSNHPDVMLKMMLRPGDFQFINNRTILHGRAAFDDYPEKMLRRHLYRLWLNVPEWPRMPASQSTLVLADMARWDAQSAERRAVLPA
jgi:Taurine catabolism dioxygenase TauD, TfdA family